MLTRKVTDFVRLEEGNISKKSALTVGSVLAIAAMSVSPAQAWPNCCWTHDPMYPDCDFGPAELYWCCSPGTCPQGGNCWLQGYLCC